ncbi:hypothetical protein [Cytobacillus kochii]|uniref:Uncharacterized protein n=1 Tax=Cytobacillus kochii TaxID=859143 RepID=A0A248TH95_9BACI|nr:hypothetical protein [Cytobacillus kochii]ASV67545.1 hypothetical protein CKF48_09535 [Cytobacillus kochii]
MENNLKNLKEKMNSTILKEVQFEKKHKLTVLKKIEWSSAPKRVFKQKISYAVSSLLTAGLLTIMFYFTLNQIDFNNKESFLSEGNLAVSSDIVSPLIEIKINGLEKYPDQLESYLNALTALNEGDHDMFIRAFSEKFPIEDINAVKENYNDWQNQEKKMSTEISLVHLDTNKAILLSKDEVTIKNTPDFDTEAYIILNKEQKEWKVLDIIPFKRVERRLIGESDTYNFDITKEVREQIENEYQINFEG